MTVVNKESVFLDECMGETQLLQTRINTLAQTQVKKNNCATWTFLQQ